VCGGSILKGFSKWKTRILTHLELGNWTVEYY
jgi:hypothetical protein